MKKLLKNTMLAALICGSVGALAFGQPQKTAWTSPAHAESINAQLVDFFEGAETRTPGSPGNLLMEKKIAEIFKASGLENGEIAFAAPAFEPGKAELKLETGESVELMTLHPTAFRPGNFKTKSFKAPLIYLGNGGNNGLEMARGKNLNGAIAVLEFDSEWTTFLRFGVQGFIFLPSDSILYADAISKVFTTETSIPRFYADAEYADMLREALAENVVMAEINSEHSRWSRKELRNLWVFIPGTDQNLSKEVSVLLAPIDSNCVVPDLAYGAQSAANLYVLMDLFKKFKENPPARSTLIVAVNAHTQRFMGERMLAWHLFGDTEKIRNILHTDIRVSQVYLDFYGKLELKEFNKNDENILLDLRTAMDDTTALNILVKNPIVALAKGDMNSKKLELLELQRRQQSLTHEEYTRKFAQLEKERDEYINVLTLFNKVGIKTTLSDLNENELNILRGYVRHLIDTHTLFLQNNTYDLEQDIANGKIRDVLQGRKVAFVVGLDLDFSSDQIGFSVGGAVQTDGTWSVKWGENTVNLAASMPSVKEEGKRNLLIDTLSMQGGITERYYFRDSGLLKTFRDYFYSAPTPTPAFSLRNTYTDRGNRFLPSDTFANLNNINFVEAKEFIGDFLATICSDPNITLQSELPATSVPKSAQLWTTVLRSMKFDELASSSVVPDLPVGKTAIVLNQSLYRSAMVNGDVLNAYITYTDERGIGIFYGLAESTLMSQCFQFDNDFVKVLHAIDVGDKQLKINSNISSSQESQILPLFECKEFNLISLSDSSQIPFGLAVGSVIPLSSIGDAPPRVYGVSGIRSTVTTKSVAGAGMPSASLFLKEHEKIKIVTGGKRLLLNPSEEYPEGRGFADPSEIGSDVFARIAKYMSVLNKARIDRLRDVANELARHFMDRGNSAIVEMDEALEEGYHMSYLRHLYEAVGSQVKSYWQSKETIDDMLKAVVVYMALLLPFCFFVQKLIFNFVKIEKQMAAYAGLFILTYVVFRLIHPAFRVAQAAEAILVAFIMGVLGLFVIGILRGRFETEMQMLFRNFSVAFGDDVDYSAVGQKAMLIGVNNMKRRRMRTTLTTATIVLVAFTMLSFTSISKKVNPTMIPRGRNVPYSGLMVHLPGDYYLDQPTVDVLDTMFRDSDTFVLRRWLTPEESDVPFHLKCNNGNYASVDAVLGLPEAEDGFLDKIPLVAGSYFSGDNAKEALIAASLAEALGVDPNRVEDYTLTFQGTEVKLVGIVDDVAFRSLKDLNDTPILPIKYISTDTGSTSQQELQEMMMSGQNMSEGGGEGIFFYVDMSSLLILPERTSRKLGAQPYSVSVKFREDQEAWPAMDTLLTATDAQFFLSSVEPFTADEEGKNLIPAGIYYVGSNYKTAIGGLAVLIIPLLITSTIILNTMLGSVYERKNEIAVYNAVGLNPHHIGMFFLAESFVYGVIGAVGGYLIGQLLSILITAFNLVKGINLNYSSMSVAYVIIFTVAVVVLSTIYPALVATEAAVPSGKRKWWLTQHDRNRMEVLFPFIYHPKLAIGIVTF
ncbi:MAG: FtsX-like permease family protein, partial [Lentisphaerae bacterium]|nr:FtsX-like permease family protein [Lentisphaerota bacterium]